jgi:sugar (pentulose or hexulose) kinase
MAETVATSAEAEANSIRSHQPELAAAYKTLPLGYLTYRLVGQFVDSVAARWAMSP